MVRTLGDLEDLARSSAKSLGIVGFECKAHDPANCFGHVDLLTTPLTLYERDQIYETLRPNLPFFVSLNIKSTLRQADASVKKDP